MTRDEWRSLYGVHAAHMPELEARSSKLEAFDVPFGHEFQK